MATSTSPPPTILSSQHRALSDKLDNDIARMQAEIQALRKQKTLLTASLLSSTRIQSHLDIHAGSQEPNGLTTDLTPLQSQAQHNETNIHRLAYGVTSFPFTDPNPDTSDRPLLGVRFDIPSYTGRFERAPYFILFKRSRDNHHRGSSGTEPTHSPPTLKIHHHTVPALVPLQAYEAKYLPQPDASGNGDTNPGRDEGYFSPSPPSPSHSSTTQTQDLHALVAAVRRDLTSWHQRTDAILLLAESLGLSNPHHHTPLAPTPLSHSLQSCMSTALDARFCRLVWRNGTVGRIRITDDGYVDKAVVLGGVGTDGKMRQMKDVERMLCTGRHGEALKVVDLRARLMEVEGSVIRMGEKHGDDIHDDEMQVDD